MKTLVSIFALSMALAFTAPAVAGTGQNSAPPTMKSTCEKAKMKWDEKLTNAALPRRQVAIACDGECWANRSALRNT